MGARLATAPVLPECYDGKGYHYKPEGKRIGPGHITNLRAESRNLAL